MSASDAGAQRVHSRVKLTRSAGVSRPCARLGEPRCGACRPEFPRRHRRQPAQRQSKRATTHSGGTPGVADPKTSRRGLDEARAALFLWSFRRGVAVGRAPVRASPPR